MKHWKFTVLLIFSLVFLQACNVTVDVGGSNGSKSDLPLAVSVDAPTQGSQAAMGPIDIRYTATAPEGVAVVELMIDGYVVNSYTSLTPLKTQLLWLTVGHLKWPAVTLFVCVCRIPREIGAIIRM